MPLKCPAVPACPVTAGQSGRNPAATPAPSPSPSPGSKPLAGKIVGIDPGHNGGNFTDPGAIAHLIWNGTGWESCDTTGTTTDSGQPRAPTAFARVIAKVSRNHGHVFAVSFDDVKAGIAKAYDLSGISGHPHEVTLSSDHMKSLMEGQIVRLQSTRVGGHAHYLFVRCAPAVDLPEWVSACEIAIANLVNVSHLADVSDYVVSVSEGHNPVTNTPSWSQRGYLYQHDRRTSVWALIAKLAIWAAQEAGKTRQ